jgi:uncharacterized repeat protein (TIGR01451 family)
VAVSASIATAAITETPVLATRASELQPAANTSYFAWTFAPRLHPRRFGVYARAFGSAKFKVNPAGTRAFTHNNSIDGTTLVYQQRPRLRVAGNLVFFDLVTKTRSSPPAGINTRQHECCASLSGDWLLFRRANFRTGAESIRLVNLVTGQLRILASAARPPFYFIPGAVAGDYVTWLRCPGATFCRTWRYQISTGASVLIPNPFRKARYALSNTSEGTVYFAESGNVLCGAARRLWRWDPLGGGRALFRFPRNRDPAISNPVLRTDGSTTIYYDRANCRTGISDVYKVTEPGRSDLSIMKTSSADSLAVGEPLTFELTVSNAGPTTAKAISLTDGVPAAFSVTSVTPSQGSCNVTGNDVSCALGNLAAGTSATVTIVVSAVCAATTENTASAASAWIDPDPSDNQATKGATVTGSPSC